MSPSEYAAWAQAAAGIATFGAAVVATVATYEAPKRAAQFAERLRASSSAAEKQRDLQMALLFNLMRHRRKASFSDSYETLNLIDLVFSDSKKVRDAWHHFHSSIIDPSAGAEVRIDRYNSIIQEMVGYLGLGDSISVSDVSLAYYPNLAGQQEDIRRHEIQARWNELFRTLPPVPDTPQ